MDRIHRLGKYKPGQQYSRLIIAKFERFKDKEFVRQKAPSTLVNESIDVNEHCPMEMENKRKLLYPEVKKKEKKKEDKTQKIKCSL